MSKIPHLGAAPLAPHAGAGGDRSHHKRGVEELSWSQFGALVHALAAEVRKQFRPQAVVGVAHGGVFVGGALASVMGAEFYPVRISRRSRDAQTRSAAPRPAQMPRHLKGRRVLIVDDVASSGDTLQLAVRLAKEKGATQIRTACLIRREDGFHPDWCARDAAGLVVFPWDYRPLADDDRFEEHAPSPAPLRANARPRR